jgi:hypothetical protein
MTNKANEKIHTSMYIQPRVLELGFAPQGGILLLYVTADSTL